MSFGHNTSIVDLSFVLLMLWLAFEEFLPFQHHELCPALWEVSVLILESAVS